MKRALSTFTALLTLLAASSAWAGMVDTYGIGARAAAMGGAVSASASPAFAPYYNPAALTKAKRASITAGSLVTQPEVSIDNYSMKEEPSTDFTDDTDPLVVPHISAVLPMGVRFTAGVAVYVPWGMKIDWKKNTLGAHNSYHSEYLREVITPTLAWKATDKLSIGGGISFGQSETGASFIRYKSNTTFEGKLKDDFNTSFNVGALYQATDRLSMGLTYRSRTSADFEGDLKINGVKTTTVKMSYDHPEQIQTGVAYRLGKAKNILVEADATWTNWSINKSQLETFSPAIHNQNSKETPRNWDDTVKYSLGVEWVINPTITLRGGYLWDPTPVPDESLDFIWPDGDKHILSIGTGLTFGQFTVDIAASYANIPGRRVIKGESGALNPSYGKKVSLVADGKVYNIGITTTYHF